MIEGKPKPDNEEGKEYAGGYINCWVKADDQGIAKGEAIEYINNEGWDVIMVEESFITDRNRYSDLPDSLECFDQADNFGLGAMFNTWPV